MSHDLSADLIFGPPRLVWRRVTVDMDVVGRDVAILQDDGTWLYDYRAVTNPFFQDFTTLPRITWQRGEPTPDGVTEHARPCLSVCREADYFAWQMTKRRPQVYDIPLSRLWIADVDTDPAG